MTATTRMTPRQHDVFPNPDVRNRGAYPFVAVLQANTFDGDRRIIAPLARRVGPLAGLESRAAPAVRCAGQDLVLVLPLLGTAPVRRLRAEPFGSVRDCRDDITRALDWLPLGL